MVVGGFSQSCLKLQKSWLLPICYTVKTQWERRTAGGREMIASGAVSARWPAPPLLTTGVMFRNVLELAAAAAGPRPPHPATALPGKMGGKTEERREKWRHRIHHQAGETSMMGPSFWGARVLVHYSFKIWILIDCLNLIFIFIIIVNVKISTYKSSKQDHCLYMLNHHSSRF